MPISYSHNDKVSRSKIPSRTFRLQSDSEDAVCVKQMCLGGNCRASPVVSVSSKTRLAQLIHSSLEQPLQHGTVVAVCAAAFVPVSVIVTDPHSTNVSLISHISP